LRHIQRVYPHVITIACGAPFQDSSSLVDVIRLSKDTALPPFVPKFINKFVYGARVKMLQETLLSPISPKLNLDPDVRMFSLDTHRTDKFWDTIQTLVIGVGDNLTTLSLSKITKLKLWLTHHNSQ
jgi:hypothetical protein